MRLQSLSTNSVEYGLKLYKHGPSNIFTSGCATRENITDDVLSIPIFHRKKQISFMSSSQYYLYSCF